MATHVVTALHLNLRAEPDSSKKNVIAVLPQGTPVDKLGNSGVAGWFRVRVALGGAQLEGHVAHAHLGAAGTTTFPTASTAGGRLPKADLGSWTSAKRSFDGAWAFSIGEGGKPGLPSTHAQGRAKGILRIIDWMNVEKGTHLRWKGGGGKTFCNVYTYDVCDTAGAYIPRVWWTDQAIAKLRAGQSVEAKYDVTVREIRANQLFGWLSDHGPDFGWERVFDLDTLQAGANSGRIGIICAQRHDLSRPGHIQVIAPEHGSKTAKRNSAGAVTQPLQSNAGATNFNYGQLGSTWWQGANFRQFGFWLNDVG